MSCKSHNNSNVNSNNNECPQAFIYNSDVSDAFILERLPWIDSAYQRMIDNGYMPQCVTMVIHNGRVVHNKAFGWRDIEKQIPC